MNRKRQMDVTFRLNQEILDKLKTMQTLLGTTDLKSTANLLMGLGAHVVSEATKGGQVGILKEEGDTWDLIKHPALDNIRKILKENDSNSGES